MNESKVALVTGAGRGVGKGVAVALGTEGWTVYLTGRRQDRLLAAAEAVTAAGGTGHALVCDHRDDEQVRKAFAQIAEEQGRLDLLVNNAWSNPPDFIGFTAPFWKRPVSDWDTLIGIGLRAHYVSCVEAAKIMVPQGSGLMANISSFGSRGYLHSVLYGMSKTGLDKM
ncbi:MAG: SDR family NAD(P)-dependent oxidoreductase, partial [Mycobacteriaceae bacterium]